MQPGTGYESRGGVEKEPRIFFNLDAKLGWMVNATLWPFYPRKTDTLPTVEEAVWAPLPIWTGAENLSPHQDSIPGASSP